MFQIFEKLFLKKRFILKWNPIKHNNQLDCKGYSIGIVNSFNDIDDFISKDIIFIKRNHLLLKKLKDFEWKLFTITEETSKELAGYYFALISINKQKSHDNYIIMPNDALMCHAFIYPTHRKKGLYKT